MKFTILKSHLERALTTAERFTGKNITLPVLGNVFLQVIKNTLHIRATNLESAVEISLSGDDPKEGTVCVPAKVANAMVQSCREEKIKLEGRQGSLVFTTNHREVKVNGVSPEEFPLIPKVSASSSFSLPITFLKEGLEEVAPAISPSDFKPELSGVFFSCTAKKLRLAATDTFRLAEKTLSFEGKREGASSFILPARATQELIRIFHAAPEGEATIGTGDNQACITLGGVKVTTRLVEGNFPDYQRVIPQEHLATCFLSREELSDAVRGAGVFTSKLQEVKLHFKGKTLTINAANTEIGEYRTTLTVSPIDQEMTMSFNHRYLLDGVNSLTEEEIFFGLGGEKAPSLLRNRTDNSFCYVLMPLQIT